MTLGQTDKTVGENLNRSARTREQARGHSIALVATIIAQARARKSKASDGWVIRHARALSFRKIWVVE